MTTHFSPKLLFVGSLLLTTSAVAQTLILDPIGVGPSVTVSGSGGPPSSSVELIKNGVSVGSIQTTANGLFSIPNIGTASNDVFQVQAGQVWNFNANGNAENWNALAGDASVVNSGTWRQTNSAGTDMSVNLYGDNLIRTRARVLEVKLRYIGSGNRTGSVIMQTAGPNGVSGGGDDPQSIIVNTFTLSSGTNLQTLVFDLGIDHNGAATCWLDGTAPINVSLYIPSTAIGDAVEVDYIRLTEAMNWEFNSLGDVAEWAGNANTTLLATNLGYLRLRATVAGTVAMARPFRILSSTHFVTLQTRFRQVTATQPNLLHWNYFSQPSSFGTGGKQFSALGNGSFQTITTNLTGTPTYGLTWTNGGGATLNFSQEAYVGMFANLANEYAEVDYIRLLPAAPYGPSATVIASGSPVVPFYYVSSSGGSDFNSGRSIAQPWATFTNLDSLTLGAGTTVHLKRGDTWANKMLRLTGKGSATNPITLTAYGDGPSPLITGINLTNAPCIQWENPAHVRIEAMDCRDAKIGLYLRYTGGNLDGTGEMFRNTNVVVTACHFQNLNEKWSALDGSITVLPPYEISWGTGIWIGGNVPSPGGGPWASTSTPILDGLTITHCGFKDVSVGVSANFYYPPAYRSRFTNFRFEDSWVTGCEAGSFAMFFVDGGHARRVDTWIGGTNFYNTGTTGGFLQDCQNFTVADCEFAGNKRNATGHDGCGFDFEGDCHNISFTNNVLHDNDGSALLILNTVSNNTALKMTMNTAWNNARNPLDAGENAEFRYNPPGSTGTFTNIGVYRGATNAFGAVAVYDNATRWNNFLPANIRSGTTWASVSSRPVAWNFTSTVEGWGAQNQWTGFATSGGALVGTSAGVDPYAESAATWVNTRERRWVHVRMSQTAGTTAQVFFQVETDATFTGPKAVAFPIIADGVMRDYIVDMGGAATYQGVVTKWRLDPTDAAGSVMGIDVFESVINPYLVSITPVSTRVLDLRFNQAMLPDGGVFNPANYTLSGSGQGTLASNPSSVSLMATSNGPIYRLTWNSGDMNGAAATLTAANSQNARSYPLWAGGTAISFLNPLALPTITSFSPFTGRAGTNVVIFGTNFTGTTSVLFNGLTASYTVNNNNQITATVPPGATTGPISLTTSVGGANTSSNFTIVPITSDLLVTIASTPNPVTIGSNVTTIITVKNLGDDTAPSVMLTNTLPVGAILLSAVTMQGTLATNANVITANVGTLASNATAVVTLVFTPPAVGGISVTATSGSANPDPNAGNSSTTEPTFVEPLPVLTLGFVAPDQVNLHWSGLLSNWVLQANANLTTNVSWSNVLTTPVWFSGTNTVTETNSAAAKFYRLKR